MTIYQQVIPDTPFYTLSHTSGALSTPLRNIACPSHHRQRDVSALHPHDVLLLKQVASALVLWTVGKKEGLSSIIPYSTSGTPTQHV
jgi:hypothetical protein